MKGTIHSRPVKRTTQHLPSETDTALDKSTPLVQDIVEDYLGAKIQHGRLGDRVYVMDLTQADPEAVARGLSGFALENGYGKCIVKAPFSMAAPFIEKGYHCEARIPGYFNGKEEVLFLALFTDPKRAHENDPVTLDGICHLAMTKARKPKTIPTLPDIFRLRTCTPDDTVAMSAIYREVFPSYPFPIHDPEYLRQTMASHIAYYAIETGQSIVALASAEMDEPHGNVEMTDFATRPDWRGHRLAVHLLSAMDTAMHQRGLKTYYTIARAVSPSMNITFARCGYQYAGRLANNTPISGAIESMNIWFKPSH